LAPDGTITHVNRTFLAWTGYSRQGLAGLVKFNALLTAPGRIVHETHFMPSLEIRERADDFVYDVVCAGGRVIPLQVNAATERDSTGRLIAVHVSLVDASRWLDRANRRADT
jgi:PAS domain S-box-containing protein